MAANSVLSVTVYNFDSTGNKYVNKQLRAIPLPCEILPASSPDSLVYVYSKILYQSPDGFRKEAYTAETVAQLVTRINA
jgi:hypothetical protein